MVQTQSKPSTFNSVDLLVHPYFALENVRVKGEAMDVQNVTSEELIKDYNLFSIPKNWESRIGSVKSDPHAIMVIVGVREMEVEFHTHHTPFENNPSFFKGQLSAQKLKQFSKEYQELLHYAKKTLGGRLIYVSQSLSMKPKHFDKLLITRGLLPAKRIKINAYGEYFEQCVKGVGGEALYSLNALQNWVWRGRAKTHLNLILEKRSGIFLKKKVYSIGEGMLSGAEIARESMRTKGNLTEEFVKRRLRIKNPSESWQRLVDHMNADAKAKLARKPLGFFRRK
ncbi:MAG: hypothetical protein AABW59_02840 [archaeon]